METEQFIIEVIKYGSWPIVTILGMTGLYFLKDKIGLVFGGVKSAKVGENEIQFYENKQSLPTDNQIQQDLQHLIPVDPTGIRGDLEEKINKQLSEIKGDYQKIDILVKHLAQQQISSMFEKVYYLIFGSQIRLLEFLSVQPDGKAPAQALAPFFEITKYNNPEHFGTDHFSDFMQFLLNWQLVENHGGDWGITKNGRAFIIYITAMRLDKNKSF